MPPENQISRYEINRNVRMVLARHDADMARIDYSSTGGTVYLYGDLVRSDRDYTASEIDAIIGEISSLQHVRDIQIDFNNWQVVSSGDSRRIIKIGKPAATRAASQSGSLIDSTVIINNAEALADVIDDIAPNSEKK